jgi:hypothetical protein
MEIEMETTQEHVANVPLEQAYTTLHKALESRPGLRNVVLHEIAGLISGYLKPLNRAREGNYDNRGSTSTASWTILVTLAGLLALLLALLHASILATLVGLLTSLPSSQLALRLSLLLA